VAEVIFRLPSKLPYGYVELHATAEELSSLPDPEMLGGVYAAFVEAYRAGEKAGFERGEASKGNHVLVPSRGEVLAQTTDRVVALSEGLSDRLAVVDSESDAASLLVATLGATVLESVDADAPYAKPALAVKKPWEQGGAKPKPVPNLFD